MAPFIERNKKKSVLALLLLLWRTKRALSVLLVVAALGTFLLVTPSSLIVHLPGGVRAAAGIAWLADKMGVDTSQWGLGGGAGGYGGAGGKGYNDLLAAFRAVRDGDSQAGWDMFMRGGKGRGGRGGAGSGDGAGEGDGSGAGGAGSLGFVKGSAKDLTGKDGVGEKLSKSGDVDGILNPGDIENGGEDGVALSDEEMRGRRGADGEADGMGDGDGEGGGVKSAFAGGLASVFGNSPFGSRAGNAFAGGRRNGGPGSLSGSPFVGPGSFRGGGSAPTASLANMIRNAGNAILGRSGTVNPYNTGRARAGRLSRASGSAVRSRSRPWGASRAIGSQLAFIQLAAAFGRAMSSTSPNCTASAGCAPEFPAWTAMTTYDIGHSGLGGLDAQEPINIDGGPNTNVLTGGPGGPGTCTTPSCLTAGLCPGPNCPDRNLCTGPNCPNTNLCPGPNCPDGRGVDVDFSCGANAPTDASCNAECMATFRQIQTTCEEREQCENAIRATKEDEERLFREGERETAKFDQMGCGKGGCSKKKARDCKAQGEVVKDNCKALSRLFYNRCMACPPFRRQGCFEEECDGPARELAPASDRRLGVNFQTADGGQEPPECSHARAAVPTARENTRNALTVYRGRLAQCTELSERISSLEAEHAASQNTTQSTTGGATGGTSAGATSGTPQPQPESAALVQARAEYARDCPASPTELGSSCRSYATSICDRTRACDSGTCEAETDACDTNDLGGIEAFINNSDVQ